MIKQMGLIKHQLKKVSDLFFLNYVLDVEFRIENIQRNNKEKSSELIQRIENEIDE